MAPWLLLLLLLLLLLFLRWAWYACCRHHRTDDEGGGRGGAANKTPTHWSVFSFHLVERARTLKTKECIADRHTQAGEYPAVHHGRSSRARAGAGACPRGHDSR